MLVLPDSLTVEAQRLARVSLEPGGEWSGERREVKCHATVNFVPPPQRSIRSFTSISRVEHRSACRLWLGLGNSITQYLFLTDRSYAAEYNSCGLGGTSLYALEYLFVYGVQALSGISLCAWPVIDKSSLRLPDNNRSSSSVRLVVPCSPTANATNGMELPMKQIHRPRVPGDGCYHPLVGRVQPRGGISRASHGPSGAFCSAQTVFSRRQGEEVFVVFETEQRSTVHATVLFECD